MNSFVGIIFCSNLYHYQIFSANNVLHSNCMLMTITMDNNTNKIYIFDCDRIIKKHLRSLRRILNMYSEHTDFAVSLTPCEWDQYMLLIDAQLHILRKFRSKSFTQMKPICHLQFLFFFLLFLPSFALCLSYDVALFLYNFSSSIFVFVFASVFLFLFFRSSCQGVLSSYSNRVRNFQIFHNLRFGVYWIPCQIE